MKNHEGMSMPGDKKDQKQNAPDAGKGKSNAAPKKDDAATKQKTGHEGHDMTGKGAKK